MRLSANRIKRLLRIAQNTHRVIVRWRCKSQWHIDQTETKEELGRTTLEQQKIDLCTGRTCVTICRRAAYATMMRYICYLLFHVLLLWIKIEITFCRYLRRYLLTFIFIEFFANVTIIFLNAVGVWRHQFALTSYNNRGLLCTIKLWRIKSFVNLINWFEVQQRTKVPRTRIAWVVAISLCSAPYCLVMLSYPRVEEISPSTNLIMANIL